MPRVDSELVKTANVGVIERLDAHGDWQIENVFALVLFVLLELCEKFLDGKNLHQRTAAADAMRGIGSPIR